MIIKKKVLQVTALFAAARVQAQSLIIPRVGACVCQIKQRPSTVLYILTHTDS